MENYTLLPQTFIGTVSYPEDSLAFLNSHNVPLDFEFSPKNTDLGHRFTAADVQKYQGKKFLFQEVEGAWCRVLAVVEDDWSFKAKINTSSQEHIKKDYVDVEKIISYSKLANGQPHSESTLARHYPVSSNSSVANYILSFNIPSSDSVLKDNNYSSAIKKLIGKNTFFVLSECSIEKIELALAMFFDPYDNVDFGEIIFESYSQTETVKGYVTCVNDSLKISFQIIAPQLI